MASTPHIVGYQCAGTITEVGEGVEHRHLGQQVVTTMMHGSHAEKVVTFAEMTWPVPESADLREMACVPIASGTAHDCLFEFGHLTAGETVLVQAGAGGVGIAAVQLASQAGATVFATASSPERLARLEPLGLDQGFDYTADGWIDDVRAATDGRGVDLVVDPVGGRVLTGSVACLTRRGRCVTVGNAGRDAQPFDTDLLMMGNTSLTGVFFGGEIMTPRVHELVTQLLDAVASGDLTVVIDRTFPLADAADAHAYIESRQAFGRVVLIP
jgi:NADPH2:quinone reductase